MVDVGETENINMLCISVYEELKLQEVSCSTIQLMVRKCLLK